VPTVAARPAIVVVVHVPKPISRVDKCVVVVVVQLPAWN
jgi:hypothetical protein